MEYVCLKCTYSNTYLYLFKVQGARNIFKWMGSNYRLLGENFTDILQFRSLISTKHKHVFNLFSDLKHLFYKSFTEYKEIVCSIQKLLKICWV